MTSFATQVLHLVAYRSILCQLFAQNWPTLFFGPSRGGLVVERWSDNRLDSASVGSNLHLGMIYQSLSSLKAMSHIHMNAERWVPSGVYDKCPRC